MTIFRHNDHFHVQQTAMMCAPLQAAAMHYALSQATSWTSSGRNFATGSASHVKAVCGFSSRALSFYMCLPKMLGFVVRPLKPEITARTAHFTILQWGKHVFCNCVPATQRELREGQGGGERQMGFFDTSAMGLPTH